MEPYNRYYNTRQEVIDEEIVLVLANQAHTVDIAALANDIVHNDIVRNSTRFWIDDNVNIRLLAHRYPRSEETFNTYRSDFASLPEFRGKKNGDTSAVFVVIDNEGNEKEVNINSVLDLHSRLGQALEEINTFYDNIELEL